MNKNKPQRFCSLFQGLDIDSACQLFEESSAGMLILDENLIARSANSALSKISGCDKGQIIGRNLYDLISTEDHELLKQCLAGLDKEGQKGGTERIRFRTCNDLNLWCRTTINALFSNDKPEPQAYIVIAQDVTEQRQAEEQIKYLAYYDTLTDLPNRTLFRDRFEQALAQAKRGANQLAIIYLDLDRFKAVNDTCGHDAGDRLLELVAERIKGCVREADTLARLSGDEFAILMPHISDTNQAEALCRKVTAIMAEPFNVADHLLQISTSMGVGVYPEDGQDTEVLMRAADLAMFEAKTRGRNMFVFHSSQINERAMSRLSLEKELRVASFENEFELVYQPQVRADDRSLCGVEALVRWNHQGKGQISPGRFIPMAEETGLILLLGEWILRTACEQTVAWLEAGLDPVKVAVNVSASQIKHPGFPNIVKQILQQTGVPPEKIELEITEGIFLGNAKEVANALWRIKDLGVSFAIDDFGTGYSSFIYLKHLPIDRVKIAREFISDILKDEDDAAIVEAIVAIANSLKLNLLAEGVETADQVEAVMGSGCFEMQGYYFSKPLGKDELTACLKAKLSPNGQCEAQKDDEQ